jgi:hypothetical protein
MTTGNSSTYKNINGYLCYKKNKKLVHRCVMEEYLAQHGQTLHPGEVVHHIDGNILNNDVGNLEVFKNQSEHSKYHLDEKRNEDDDCDNEDDECNDDDYDEDCDDDDNEEDCDEDDDDEDF